MNITFSGILSLSEIRVGVKPSGIFDVDIYFLECKIKLRVFFVVLKMSVKNRIANFASPT